MAVKIRLARKGRKKLAYYHIVVADSRSPRDGRYIEKIGTYNPITNPATIELDFDKAMGWLQNGAIPTDTCRAILSYKGVLIKKHLLEGVKKGAFDEAEANRRFEAWLKEHDAKVEAKKSGLEKSYNDEMENRLAIEKGINEERAARIAKRNAELAAQAKAETEETASGESAAEATAEEATTAEEPASEAAAEEVATDEVAEGKTEDAGEEQAPVAEDTASEETPDEKPQE
ncbi:MAG TPA: 30S ribosomal protein S16 [Bacteroidales bacterium]|nr:30S ribosomal protein S16 [Bacteroidales bacterium]